MAGTKRIEPRGWNHETLTLDWGASVKRPLKVVCFEPKLYWEGALAAGFTSGNEKGSQGGLGTVERVRLRMEQHDNDKTKKLPRQLTRIPI